MSVCSCKADKCWFTRTVHSCKGNKFIEISHCERKHFGYLLLSYLHVLPPHPHTVSHMIGRTSWPRGWETEKKENKTVGQVCFDLALFFCGNTVNSCIQYSFDSFNSTKSNVRTKSNSINPTQTPINNWVSLSSFIKHKHSDKFQIQSNVFNWLLLSNWLQNYGRIWIHSQSDYAWLVMEVRYKVVSVKRGNTRVPSMGTCLSWAKNK